MSLEPDSEATRFVARLSARRFNNVFNPYANACSECDLDDAPRRRSQMLAQVIDGAMRVEVDALWIGRDLGYRGGRRTGLALTDDVHIDAHMSRWGLEVERPTRGAIVAERTAAVVWGILGRIEAPIFLWNVFPFHPYEKGDPFSNRAHNAEERAAGASILRDLLQLLRPRRIVAIGNDAGRAANDLGLDLEICQVRHPSYGGQAEFRDQIRALYRIE